jgi:hypothetical protein
LGSIEGFITDERRSSRGSRGLATGDGAAGRRGDGGAASAMGGAVRGGRRTPGREDATCWEEA